MKPINIPDVVRVRLLEGAVWGIVYGRMTSISCRDLGLSGRPRFGLWKRLLAEGYLCLDKVATDNACGQNVPTDLVTPSPVAPVNQRAFVTRKFFDETPLDPERDPAQFFRYDRHVHNEGRRVWTSFAQLPLEFRVAVVKRLEADPSYGRLLAFYDRGSSDTNPLVTVPFTLGGAVAAQTQAAILAGQPNRSHVAVPVLVTASIEAKYRKEAGDRLLKYVGGSGLDWYLQKAGVFEGESGVPVHSPAAPSLGFHAALPGEPEKWGEAMPGVLDSTRAALTRAQARLAALEKLQAHVDSVGGWEAFGRLYNEAVQGYCVANPPPEPNS